MPGVVEAELITTIESPLPDGAGAAGGSLTGSVTSAGGSAGAAGGSLTGSVTSAGGSAGAAGGSLTGSVTSAGGSAGAAGGSLTGSVTSAGGSAGAAGGSLTGSVTSAGGSAGATGSAGAGASLTGSESTWARATPADAKQTRAIASATPRCGVFGGRVIALIPRSPGRPAVSVGEKLPSDWPHVTRTLVMTGKVRLPPFRNRCSRRAPVRFLRAVQFSRSNREVCRGSAQEFDDP